ncbi:MAG: DUF2461 domain-containing protein [Pseudomonadota bacterium]
MTTPMIASEGFALLEGLIENNNREWFTANRQAFEDALIAPFAAILEAASERLAAEGAALSGSRDTMFRMNRDVRFSKDNPPYKTAVSGVLTRSGKKSDDDGLAYLHLEAEGGFAAVGFYNLSPAALGPIRDAIIERAAAFDTVLGGLRAAGRELSDGKMLSAMPRGYAEHAAHRHAEHLRRKSLIIKAPLDRSAWTSTDATDALVRLVLDGMPLLDFVRSARGVKIRA